MQIASENVKMPLAWIPLVRTSRYVLVMCALCTYLTENFAHYLWWSQTDWTFFVGLYQTLHCIVLLCGLYHYFSQKLKILEGLLHRSNYTQHSFLWTATQPALHRDFMYTSQVSNPSLLFPPISSHVSRDTKARRAVRNYHHIKRYSYTLCTQSARCSQSDVTIPKIRISSRHALFLYNSRDTIMHSA